MAVKTLALATGTIAPASADLLAPFLTGHVRKLATANVTTSDLALIVGALDDLDGIVKKTECAQVVAQSKVAALATYHGVIGDDGKRATVSGKELADALRVSGTRVTQLTKIGRTLDEIGLPDGVPVLGVVNAASKNGGPKMLTDLLALEPNDGETAAKFNARRKTLLADIVAKVAAGKAKPESTADAESKGTDGGSDIESGAGPSASSARGLDPKVSTLDTYTGIITRLRDLARPEHAGNLADDMLAKLDEMVEAVHAAHRLDRATAEEDSTS